MDRQEAVAVDRAHVSRRAFLLAGSGIAAAGIAGAQDTSPALTAKQVVERIRQNAGVPWRAETVDNIVAGDPDTPVKGIATTMMATLDVIQRSAAAGRNLLITHEPTFYLHQDKTDVVAEDPTYLFKADFIRRYNIVCFHFHDHWHAHHPDGMFPGTPLARLAKEIESRLKVRNMRVVGNPGLKVNRVAASWGYVSNVPGIPLLGQLDVDVLVVGETREWELVEYAQDAVAAGNKKALILLGHVVSEQAGMKYCAEWLKTFISEVPIEFIPAAEPFWRP